MNIITDNKSLARFCKSLRKQKFVTVDTEFIRERTFYPQLCLIQIAVARRAAVIDIMSDITDYSPLKDIFTDSEIIKVFHSARQDLEAIFYFLKVIPFPVFDTQIGAMALGFGDSVSYQSLVHHFCKVNLDKGQRLTDWSKRPLSEAQLAYALGDVSYLVKVYRRINEKIVSLGRGEWIKEEENDLLNKENYVINPERAWKRLKLRSSDIGYIARLKQIAALRETIAVNTNRPRRFVMSDDVVEEIALLGPKTAADLASVRGIVKHPDGAVRYEKEILEAVAFADVSNADLLSVPIKKMSKKLLRLRPLTEMLKLLLNIRCLENNVSARLVASHDDIDDIVLNGEKGKNKTMRGWRYSFFGKDALALCDGSLRLYYDRSKNRIVSILASNSV